MTATNIYAANCRSYMEIAAYWVRQKIWDRAIDALRAAIRAATRADMHDTAGRCFFALRKCQDAQVAERRLDAPTDLRDAVEASGMQ